MDTIRTALCSFGMSGKVFHAPLLTANPHYKLEAVLERNHHYAQEIYPDIKTYDSLESLLEDPSIELVIVNTPNATHYDFTRRALNAGKNVVVEKPFTLNAKEGEELIHLAHKKNLKLTVFQNRRFDSDFKTVKNILAQNLIGTPIDVTISFDRYKEGIGPKKHKEDPIPGAGTLYDLGSHIIDQALQLFGRPHKIFADIRSVRPGSQVTDEWELLLSYGKLRVRLISSYVVRESAPGYILHGLNGSFLKARTDVQEIQLQQGLQPGDESWGKEPEIEKGVLHSLIDGNVERKYVESERGDYNQFYDQLYEAIRHNAPVPVLPEEALDVVRVIEKAYESNHKGKWIDAWPIHNL